MKSLPKSVSLLHWSFPHQQTVPHPHGCLSQKPRYYFDSFCSVIPYIIQQVWLDLLSKFITNAPTPLQLYHQRPSPSYHASSLAKVLLLVYLLLLLPL